MPIGSAPGQGQNSQVETKTKKEVLIERIAQVERNLEAAKATYNKWAGNPNKVETVLSARRAIDDGERNLGLLREKLAQEAA